MQSLPVSPPPMTMTFLPLASIFLPLLDVIHESPTALLSSSDLVLLCRNSIARCTPLNSLPGQLRSRAMVAPVAQRTASNCSRMSLHDGGASVPGIMSLISLARGCLAPPMLPAAPVLKTTPSFSRRSTRRCTTPILSAFMLGTPYIISPPTRSARSYTVTRWPALLSWSAAAMPAGPEPMTATFLPVRMAGGWGLIQPCSKALSMMAHSMFLIVTGFSMMPSTHAPSHGAGHTRPVNSGKLLVIWRRSSARFQSPL
mmetsp:Transcript_67087/g.165503  ORF Transcript_67087/g.165503 Transcript_67087/m.165503 type:complete len:257 (-) Transcript_67087:1686-2456(-)